MRIHTNHEDYDVVVEQNERREKYLAVYSVTRAQVSAKVYASWQIAMLERMEELEAEVDLLKVLEEAHLKTIKELSEGPKPEPSPYEKDKIYPPSRTIILNQAACPRCGDIITSHHRHDFVTCSCGGLFVDGGNAYLRRGGETLDSYTELSEYLGEDNDE